MAAGDKAYWSDIANTINPPKVRLVAQAAQSFADNTAVAVQYGSGSDIVDTHNFHDMVTNNTRVTPGVAGYYDISVTIMHGSRADYADINTWVRKNGASNLAPAARNGFQGIAAASVESQSAHVRNEPFNGTTDYFEHMGQQNNVANVAVNTNQSSQYSCVLEARYVGPL